MQKNKVILFQHSFTPMLQCRYPKWCSRQVLAHGHLCTCTGDALDVVSLERRLPRLGLRERYKNWGDG